MKAKRKQRLGAALVVACVSAVALSGCGPKLPNSVVADSAVTIGWTGHLTSTNAATSSGRTHDNIEVAALTRSQFARLSDGVAQPDTSFGAVTVVKDDPFTVRYDLAKPTWSDGIPLDMADLVLAWAAGVDLPGKLAAKDQAVDEGKGGESEEEKKADADAPVFDAAPSGLDNSLRIVDSDESGRWIEVEFAHPVPDWQTALNVAVPAHIVGEFAFGLDDPMEAKQSVIQAVDSGDREALAKIAKVWNESFSIRGRPSDDQLLSSGPYQITNIAAAGKKGEQIHLAVNKEYEGERSPKLENISFKTMAQKELQPGVGDGLDIAQVIPTDKNYIPIRDQERRDYHRSIGTDGSQWSLVFNTREGDMSWKNARQAFMKAVPRPQMVASGAGPWSSEYRSLNTLLFDPASDGYDIAVQDAGMKALLGNGSSDASEEREAVGIKKGTKVCVLYDSSSQFASRAFAALETGMKESGWAITDCGSKDVDKALASGQGYDAALVQTQIPTTAAQIDALWGSHGSKTLTGATSDKRDELIAKLARTADHYDARDIRVEIEKTIVDDALAVPLASNPLVTLSVPQITGVQAGERPFTLDASRWAPENK